MRNTLHGVNDTGVDKHTFGPPSLIQTAPVEEEDRKSQTNIEHWAWEVHEVALHYAGQTEGLLAFGSKEPLLKKVSEEVTRQAQEKLSRDRRNRKA